MEIHHIPPKLVSNDLIEVLSKKKEQPKVKIGVYINIVMCCILVFVPFILYYCYKYKRTKKEKDKKIIEFVKYVDKEIQKKI